MAKIVKDDFAFKIERINGEILYSGHYIVESEGVEEKRGIPTDFSSQEKARILNFIKNVVLPKAMEQEGISGN